jgi:hypothetical protein
MQSSGQLERRLLDLNFQGNVLSNVSLDAAGLIAIAEITAVAKRTALTGTSALWDALVLCPGLHRQQSAPELNGGEYPAVAAMTTGYVFRVENPATVTFLQKVGETGHLTTLEVFPLGSEDQVTPPPPLSPMKTHPDHGWHRGPGERKGSASTTSTLTSRRGISRSNRLSKWWPETRGMFSCHHHKATRSDWIASAAYICAACASPALLVTYVVLQDWWGLSSLVVLMVARLCNVVVIRQRCREVGWKGASEPGVRGDLLVLLSQDRWVRLQGAVDDLKAVTSGQWMRERTYTEDILSALATLLVYLDTTVISNVSKLGQLLLLILMIASAGLLSVTNATTTAMHMHGRIITVKGKPKRYARRRDMADDLIRETKRKDWALRLGMIVDDSAPAPGGPDPVSVRDAPVVL